APARRLEPDAVAAVVAELQRPAPERRARDPNELAGLLEELGELTAAEVAARVVGDPGPMLDALRAEGRVRAVDFGNGRRALVSTIEVPMYAAIGARLTSGELETCPEQFGGSAPDPPALERILLRAVRTRGPVTAAELAGRYDVAEVAVAGALDAALARGALRQLPDGPYIHVAVLDEIQRRQAHARRVVRAVASPEGFAAFVLRRQHVHPDHRLVGPPGLLTALEPLQGEDFPVKLWEQELLPARLEGYESAWLDQLGLSGDLVWTPFERRLGRVGVALRDNLGWLREPTAEPPLAEHQKRILRQLEVRGASFVQEIARGVALDGAAILAALWELFWAGLVTPDSFQAIRRGPEPAAARRDRRRYRPAGAPLTAGGRWSVFAAEDPVTAEQRDEAWAQLLLARYGVVARELARGDWSRLRHALRMGGGGPRRCRRRAQVGHRPPPRPPSDPAARGAHLGRGARARDRGRPGVPRRRLHGGRAAAVLGRLSGAHPALTPFPDGRGGAGEETASCRCAGVPALRRRGDPPRRRLRRGHGDRTAPEGKPIPASLKP